MPWLPHYFQFIITESREAIMVSRRQEIGLSLHNFKSKFHFEVSVSKPLSPTVCIILAWIVWCQEVSAHCCVICSKTTSDVSCSACFQHNSAARVPRLIWRCNFFPSSDKSSANQTLAETISAWSPSPPMVTYFRLLQFLPALGVWTNMTFAIDFHYFEVVFGGNAILFCHQSVLPDCCTIQLR